MKNLPKSLKLKKPKDEETIYLCNDLFAASSGHYFLKTSWVLSCPQNRFTGINPLKNLIQFKTVKNVEARLAGHEIPQRDLEAIIKKFDFSKYEEVERDSISFLDGYKKGNLLKKDKTHVLIGDKKSKSFLDISYAAILFFDLDSKIFKSDRDGFLPVILKKNNEIVALIAPLNPERIGEKIVWKT